MKERLIARIARKLSLGVLAILLLLPLMSSPAYGDTLAWPTYTVKVDSGYLALRSDPSYNEKNEIGELYTGDVVFVLEYRTNGSYWKVQSLKYSTPGWVNKDYLVYVDGAFKGNYKVQVASGYLALRNAPAYDDRNEIGELYTGDVVTLLSKTDSQYWWVYSSKYNTTGYVNKDYLTSLSVAPNTYGNYRVEVSSGYLALRNAPAYDDRNEIGELYTGDIVTVLNTSKSPYWWVYSPKYNKSGYVNKDYLTNLTATTSSYGDYRVQVSSGYLALRNAPAYDDRNEIGELYTGDIVTVTDMSNGQYWWVYSSKYGKSGYVNKDYLVKR